ncbi:MAG: aspartate kinase [Bacillota bacterium]|nr:aspartate kinase [Bacillota bacterium]
MKVAKFGGTSLASAEQIRKVCSIVTADPERRLIVVSAPGKRFKDDIKVTDMLIKCAKKFLETGCAEEELIEIASRYQDIANDLGVKADMGSIVEADLRKRLSGNIENNDKFMDSMKAAGEDNSAKLVAAYLKEKGYDAGYINPRDAGMILSDEYGNARVLPESYGKLKNLRDRHGIMIFPGFFGYSKSGEVVTFPRGGSDITGSILAAAINADMYENFTDVDSVFAANPNIVDNPAAIPELTYREMRELSYAGFSVLHEETLEPVYRTGIPVCIKNTNNPDSPGTKILTDREAKNGPVVGIASDKGFCSIFISKYMMNREIGFGRKLLHILEDEGVSYEHTPSGIDNISIILRENQLDGPAEKRILNRIKDELDVDDVLIEHNLALIMIVGEGMMRTVGIAARATDALSKASVNIEIINQGASEVSIMFGVNGDDSIKAVKALYGEFFK